MVAPCSNLKPFSPMAWLFPRQFKSFLLMGHEKLPEANHVLRGLGVKLPKEELCSAKKQMHVKLRVILYFSYEFGLNCFQFQSCSFSRNLSNNRSQGLYKNEHEMVIVPKRFGTYVFVRNLSPFGEKVHCSWRKFPFIQKTYIFPRESCFLGNFLLL